MSLSRHQVREEAFQVLFALQTDSDADLATIYQSIPYHDQHQIPEYLKALVEGVNEHQGELDQEISSLLADDWTIDRLAKPDLVILRLGLFEMQYVDDVPAAVAINEALNSLRLSAMISPGSSSMGLWESSNVNYQIK